jgi:hypothetical protein
MENHSDREENDSSEIDELVQMIAVDGVIDVTEGPMTLVCVKVDEWVTGLEVREEASGNPHQFSVAGLMDINARLAAPNTDSEYLQRQLVRQERYNQAVLDGSLQKSQLFLYTNYWRDRRAAELRRMQEEHGSSISLRSAEFGTREQDIDIDFSNEATAAGAGDGTDSGEQAGMAGDDDDATMNAD